MQRPRRNYLLDTTSGRHNIHGNDTIDRMSIATENMVSERLTYEHLIMTGRVFVCSINHLFGSMGAIKEAA